jgi:ATP-dependent Lon protease
MPRPKGSPNKITAEIKERLSQVIMDAMSSIDIDSMTQNEKLKLIQIGLTYVIPRLKQVENIEEEEPRKFEIEIIDSLSKYSDKELDKAIKDSVPSNIEVQQ